jgi:hypothetical protein
VNAFRVSASFVIALHDVRAFDEMSRCLSPGRGRRGANPGTAFLADHPRRDGGEGDQGEHSLNPYPR